MPHLDFAAFPAARLSHRASLHFIRNALFALAFAISALGLQPNTSPVVAATLTVTSTAESGPGSLRQAVLDAAPFDMITFSLAGPGTITLTSPITVNKDLRIVGPGIANLTLSGGGTTRIFIVTAGTLRIENMTLANGAMRGQDAVGGNPGTYSGLGGAIFVGSGAGLTATSVHFYNNGAIGGKGGDAYLDPVAGYISGSGGGNGGVHSIPGPGQNGGFGGGGGSGSGSTTYAGNGGFGGGGGGNSCGGLGGLGGSYGGNGAGSTNSSCGFSAGGGGAGLGGAVFIDSGAAAGFTNTTFSFNQARGGNGGSSLVSGLGGGGAGGGAALGSAIFNGGSLCIQTGVSYSSNTVTAGAAGLSMAGFAETSYGQQPGQAIDTSAGVFDLTYNASCDVWYYAPTDINFIPAALPENSPAGTDAGTLSAVDLDAGDTYTYTLVPGAGDTDNASFAISTDHIVTAAVLDYEVKSSYFVRVRATDSHHKYYEKAITINITNVNDPPTNLTLAPASIAENLSTGSLIGSLTSSDADSSAFTYSLQNGVTGCDGSDNASFSISGSDLVSAVSFDFETANTYQVCIRSTDNGVPAAYLDKAFTVAVSDVNEQPTALNFTYADLYENQASGALAATLAAVDPDFGDTLTYSLVTGLGSTDNASFSISGDQLLSSAPLDYETKQSYQVRVRVTDAGGLFLEQTGLVPLLNVNEAPTGISLSNTLVDEHSSSPITTVGTLTSTDPDSSAFTYSLVSTALCTGADNAHFSIAGDQLQATSVFDFETRSSYAICVRSTDVDTAPQSVDQAFTISVNDVNEAPYGISFSPTILYENAPVATSAGYFTTNDFDLGDTFTYSLVPGTGDTDNALFSISGNDIVTAAILDYENKTSYSIRVRTTDNGGLYFETSFVVAILNVNEPPTAILLSPSTVDENLPGPLTTIGTLTSTDPDSLAFTYSLASTAVCPGTDNAVFSISGDQLQTTTVFDRETKATYSICVTSTDVDPSPQSITQVLTVTVNDLNEAPLSVAFAPVLLAENMPAGTLAGSLSTTDPDVGDTFTYTLVAGSGDTDNAFFSVSGNDIVTAAMLDYEFRPDYSVRIRSTDSGGLFIEQNITISIADQNEAPTGITLTPSNISENSVMGSLVGSLSTSDPDAGDVFTYVFVAGFGDTGNAAFTLSGNQVLTNALLDYESQSEYSIHVRSTDSKGLTVEVPIVITIDDINEPPFLSQAIPDQNFIAGQPFSFTFAASTFADPDGDVLTFTARLNSGDPLPASISFDSASRSFSGTFGQSITLVIEVTASDGKGGSASTAFSLSFASQSGNHPPILVNPIPNQLADVGVPFSFTFSTNTFADYDKDPLNYFAVLASGNPLPVWLTFNPAARTFSGLPAAADIGILQIEVHALDGRGGEASTIFDLGIASDVAPSLNIPIPDQASMRGSPWQFQLPANTFVDPNGDPLTWSARLASGNPLPSWLAFDPATRTFSGTPPETGQSAYIYDIIVTATDKLHGLQASDTFRFGHWSAAEGSGNVPPGVLTSMSDAIGSGPASLPALAARWNYTIDLSLFYGNQAVTGLTDAGLPVCFYLSLSDRLNAGNDISRLAIGTSHDGADWTLLATTRDNNASTICALADQFSLFDVFLLPPAAENASTPSPLPATGFPHVPGIVLPLQPFEKAYAAYDGLTLEIPTLGVSAPIIGVPQTSGGWDVTWLGSSAGWLDGSAFPTWTGNSVITGHVWNASNTPGIFANLEKLRFGARVKIHAFGQVYTYEVRDNFIISPSGYNSVFRHEDRAWITLVTCDGYDSATGTYRWRTVVRAVLVDVSEE